MLGNNQNKFMVMNTATRMRICFNLTDKLPTLRLLSLDFDRDKLLSNSGVRLKRSVNSSHITNIPKKTYHKVAAYAVGENKRAMIAKMKRPSGLGFCRYEAADNISHGSSAN